MNRRRPRYVRLLRLIGLAGLAVAPGCTAPGLAGDAIVEGLSNALSNLAEAGLLTFFL
ncbi:MAG: hypothetical protein JSU86_15695 [Phycisphaerales bacterium]|nr:MAG: hypothetical protein JSU86_15695 [Phycisphaerales bacterium]